MQSCSDMLNLLRKEVLRASSKTQLKSLSFSSALGGSGSGLTTKGA